VQAGDNESYQEVTWKDKELLAEVEGEASKIPGPELVITRASWMTKFACLLGKLHDISQSSIY
jgi:hypothetical protein